MESAGLVLDALGRVRDMVRDALTDSVPRAAACAAQTSRRLVGLAYRACSGCQFLKLDGPSAAMDRCTVARTLQHGRRIQEIMAPPHRHTQAQVYSAHIFSPLVLSAKPKCHAAAVTIPEISRYLVLARVLFIPQW